MSQLTQSIAGTKNLRQTGRSPITQAEDPQNPRTSAYEDIAGGTATAWAVILTALGVEHKAVEAHLKPFGQATRLTEEVHPNGTIYTQGHFETPSCTWNVAVAQIDMGNANAAMDAIRAIERFNPKAILFVGVAGGIKDVEIGDVVAASIVYGYECGKLVNDRTLPRPKLGEADYDLKQRAQAEARKDDWRSRIKSGLTPCEKPPEVYIKPIAAGEKVLASRASEIYDYLREYYDDAIAVEMEGFGFLKAAQQVKSVSAIVIRGISDLIDDKNDDTIESEGFRQTRAAHHASAFAFELLAKLEGAATPTDVAEHIDSVTFDPDQTLPEHLISVCIEVLDGGKWHLRAHYGRKSFVEPGELVAPPLLQLPTLIESDKSPENLVGEIDTCNADLQSHQSCPVGRFLRWLPLQMNSEAVAKACLMIDDRTNLGVPWELLEVEGRPLGGAVQTIHHFPDIQQPETVEPCCRGGVLAYAAAANQRWQATYRFHYYSEFREFLSNLKAPQIDYGLVYIDGLELHKALQHNPTLFIKRSRLFRSRASFVFVNGQMTFDESVSLSHSAFLTLFLRYGARGVIGNLKRVNTEAAQQVVEMFFSGCKEQNPDDQVTVPIILQRMRQQVCKRLDEEDSSDELCALYLATFLYVYYGNPQTLLHLTPADA